MNRYSILLLTLLSWTSIWAQIDFEVLDQTTHIQITSKTKLIKSFSEKVLVVDKKSSLDQIVLPYRMGEKIHSLSAKIYDLNGKLVGNIKSKDFDDFTYLTGNLYDDYRKKQYKIEAIPPFILEWEYEIELHNIVNLPVWSPQANNEVEVQKAQLEFTLPSTMNLESKFQYIVPKIDTVQNATYRIFNYGIENISTFEKGTYTGEFSDCLPKIFFKTDEFISDKYDGSNKSWKDFGQFYYSLNENKIELPEVLDIYIQKMNLQYPDKKELVAKIYADMQESMRYESVQIGIGGFESFHVKDVFENGYGDCKALSNYMRSLLIASDIETYSVLIKAGKITKDIDTLFVCSQFNHVIQCAVIEGDTIWLECTSNNAPSGYLGGFTSNRTGLLIKDGESVLVKTPSYDEFFNQIHRDISIIVEEDGTALFHVRESLSGIAQDQLRTIFKDYSESSQKKYLESYYLGYKNTILTSFKIDTIDLQSPFLEFQYTLSNSAFIKTISNRLFVNMEMLSSIFPNFEFAIDDKRFPLVYRKAHSLKDSIVIELPYSVLEKKGSNNFKTDYFKHITNWEVDENLILINREYEIDNFYIEDEILIDSLVVNSAKILKSNQTNLLFKLEE